MNSSLSSQFSFVQIQRFKRSVLLMMLELQFGFRCNGPQVIRKNSLVNFRRLSDHVANMNCSSLLYQSSVLHISHITILDTYKHKTGYRAICLQISNIKHKYGKDFQTAQCKNKIIQKLRQCICIYNIKRLQMNKKNTEKYHNIQTKRW